MCSIESHVATRVRVCGCWLWLRRSDVGGFKKVRLKLKSGVLRRSIDRSRNQIPESRRRRFKTRYLFFRGSRLTFGRRIEKIYTPTSSTGKKTPNPRIKFARLPHVSPVSIVTKRVALATARPRPRSDTPPAVVSVAVPAFDVLGSLSRVSTTHRAGPSRAPPRLGKLHLNLYVCVRRVSGGSLAELDTRGRVPATPRARVRARFA